ncbi:MAG TPA: hypothetical protein VK851_07310 [Anaerolineales bacterium]|nr:hypothetical protein [Anaerolineales bacterium]
MSAPHIRSGLTRRARGPRTATLSGAGGLDSHRQISFFVALSFSVSWASPHPFRWVELAVSHPISGRRPPGAQVSVAIDGRVKREVEVRRGFARIRISSADGEAIPTVQVGSTAEVRYMGEVLLEGTFKLD